MRRDLVGDEVSTKPTKNILNQINMNQLQIRTTSATHIHYLNILHC